MYTKCMAAYFSLRCVTICIDGLSGSSLSSLSSEYIATAAVSPYLTLSGTATRISCLTGAYEGAF
jgi:hypothetical protein